MLSELSERFCSDGLEIAFQREEVILEAATNRSKHFCLQSLQLPASFDLEKLGVQLNQLKDFLDAQNFSDGSVRRIAHLLGQKDRVMAAKKTGQRNTIGQSRLTHLAIMSTNRDMLKTLDRKKIMCDFIDRIAEGRSVFGTF